MIDEKERHRAREARREKQKRERERESQRKRRREIEVSEPRYENDCDGECNMKKCFNKDVNKRCLQSVKSFLSGCVDPSSLMCLGCVRWGIAGA